MYIVELVFLQAIGILSIIIGVLYLGEYVLKRKFNPNKEYLEEAKKVEKIRRLILTNMIIAFIVVIIQVFNKKAALLLIPMVIIDLTRHKYVLSYLNTKNENTDTRKYVLYKLYFNAIVLTVGSVIYLIFINYISCKLYGYLMMY